MKQKERSRGREEGGGKEEVEDLEGEVASF
jgi:hypothetical protein